MDTRDRDGLIEPLPSTASLSNIGADGALPLVFTVESDTGLKLAIATTVHGMGTVPYLVRPLILQSFVLVAAIISGFLIQGPILWIPLIVVVWIIFNLVIRPIPNIVKLRRFIRDAWPVGSTIEVGYAQDRVILRVGDEMSFVKYHKATYAARHLGCLFVETQRGTPGLVLPRSLCPDDKFHLLNSGLAR